MSILVGKRTVVVVQGITGTEGARAAADMKAYGTRVVAGVTPGKGGTRMSDGTPVFASVHEARRAFPSINASLICVPAPFARDAALEALWNDVPLVNILTEKMPVHDVADILQRARDRGVTVVGPSSVGILSPGKGKIGSIGGDRVRALCTPGPVGVMSKSGGMCAEICRILTDAGWGQSTVISIGGDMLIGSDFVDLALAFERDHQTRVLVVFGEVGGVAEEQLAEAMRQRRIRKPVVALIAGKFSSRLVPETVLGHAGAIVRRGRGSAQSKIRALRRAGASVVQTPEAIPVRLRAIFRRSTR